MFAERNINGDIFYELKNHFNKNVEEVNGKDLLCNLATAIVINQICDTFSLAKLDYPNTLKRPNQYQTWEQFLWKYRFEICKGACFIYKYKEEFYILDRYRIDLGNDTSLFNTKISDLYSKTLKGKTFRYLSNNRNTSSSEILFFDKLTILYDTVGEGFTYESRLNALKYPIANSKEAQESKYYNLFFTQKFLGNGKTQANEVPIQNNESESIWKNLLNRFRKIHVTNYEFQIKQLVSNLSNLKLDEALTAEIINIGAVYGVKKDVLDITQKGTTYDNKELSMAQFYDNTQMPKLNDLCAVIGIKGTFSHLPCYNVYIKTQLENLKLAKDLGLDENIIKEKTKLIYGIA